MAGIGFELRKVIGRGGLGSFLKAALSGTMIVAGPWLLSIISIFLMNRFAGIAIAEVPGLFMAVIVYSYAFSLTLFGASHFIFTRIIADLEYDHREQDASAALIIFSIAVLAVSAAIAIPVMTIMDFPVRHVLLFRISAIGLFICVSYIWILMLFISLLKWYVKILVSYGTGMAVAIAGVFIFGSHFGVAGAVLGFAIGHLLIAVLLTTLGFRKYKPGPLKPVVPMFKEYFIKYRLLFFTGLFYYWAIWADKIIFWFTRGDPVAGTFFHLYETYDIIVYFTNLTMIPGLVFFVVSSETNFYVLLRRFLVSMSAAQYAEIQKRKYAMINGMNKSIIDQSIFQGVITFMLIMLAPILYPLFSNAGHLVFRITSGAVFFHLIFLTLMNFLFYVEDYTHTLWATFAFFFVNIAIALGSHFLAIDIPAGTSYLIGALVGSLLAFPWLLKSIRVIDRKIYSGR